MQATPLRPHLPLLRFSLDRPLYGIRGPTRRLSGPCSKRIVDLRFVFLSDLAYAYHSISLNRGSLGNFSF